MFQFLVFHGSELCLETLYHVEEVAHKNRRRANKVGNTGLKGTGFSPFLAAHNSGDLVL